MSSGKPTLPAFVPSPGVGSTCPQLDDYSRYSIACKLILIMGQGMGAKPWMKRLSHRSRLPSDNGPCYRSSKLKDYLDTQQRTQPRGAAYPPMVQGRSERYPRSMKNVVKRKHEYSPWERGRATGAFIQPCNPER